MEYEVEITYDSPATQELGLVAETRLDLVASAYSIRQWTRVDQDTPKQTRALESIAKSLGVLADRVEGWRKPDPIPWVWPPHATCISIAGERENHDRFSRHPHS